MSLTWFSTHRDISWHGMPNTGISQLLLAHPGLDVAKDQLPSPWSLGAPTGKDICQRESWQLYFLFHLGLSLIHTSCSSSFSFLCLEFLPSFSHCTPPFHHCPSSYIFSLSLSLPSIHLFHCVVSPNDVPVPNLHGAPIPVPSRSLFACKSG